jgi:hypothetical protein
VQIAQHTIFNSDITGLLYRWFKTAEVLIEPCLQFEENVALRDKLMHGNFTLAIIDPVAHPCSYVIVNHMNVPYIVLSNFIEFYSLDRAAGEYLCVCVYTFVFIAGTVVPFSFVPASFDTKTDHMTFVERTTNVAMHYMLDYVHSLICIPLARVCNNKL